MRVAAAFLALAAMVALTNSHNFKKVCYFANWTVYHPGISSFFVDQIDPFLCTHLNYAFAILNNKTYLMEAHDPWMDIDKPNEGFIKFTGLKSKNPALKTLIALGGWNDSHFSTQFSEMANDPNLRKAFIAEAVKFIQQYNFDGLDIDWEYPGDPGLPEDKQNLVSLLKELREAFDPLGLLLSMSPSCTKKQAEISYDIPEIAKYVDYVNFMGYDIHGAWENYVDHHTPLFPRPWDVPGATDLVTAVLDDGITYWLEQGMPAEMIILGVPAYGRVFTLSSKDKTTILSPANQTSPGSWAGTPGQYSGEAGFVNFYEICEFIQKGWSVTVDKSGAMGPYAQNTTEWVGYDDVDMIIRKTKYAMNRNLGGIMIWEIGSDDFNGICGMGPNPIMTAVEATFSGQDFNTVTPAPPISPPPTAAPSICSAASEGKYFADPEDCRKYHACFSGVLAEGSCPTFGQHQAFNPNTYKCDLPSNVRGCETCCTN